MIRLTDNQRSYNRICGMGDKFEAIRCALYYIAGDMSQAEYLEWYESASVERKQIMDSLVDEYLQLHKIKVGA